MKKSAIIWVIVIVVVVVGGIWWWMSSANSNSANLYGSTTASSSDPSATGLSAGPLVLNTASDPTLGTYLVATNGMTLYKYTKDASNISNCTGQCAVVWPPYTVTSSSSLPAGLGIGGQINTITRADGTMQVTYNGMPLYFYSKDVNPGDTTGQNVGGIWFVVAP